MTISSRFSPEQLRSLTSRLRYLSIALAVSALAEVVLYSFILMSTANWVLSLLIASYVFLLIAALINIVDISRGEMANIWRLVGIAEVVYFFGSFFVSGMGGWYGILTVLLALAVIAQIPMSNVRGGRIPVLVPIFAVLSGVGTYLVDISWPLERFAFSMPWLVYQLIIIIGFGVICVVFGALNFGERPLRIKLIVTFAIVSLVTLLPVITYLNLANRNTLIERESEKLSGAAKQVANELDQFIVAAIKNTEVEAKFNDFILYLQLSPDERKVGWDAIVQNTTSELMLRDESHIASYSIIDADGIVIADSIGKDTGLNFSQADYFVETFLAGKSYMSPVHAELTSENTYEYFIYISAPIRDRENVIIGLLRVKYRAKVLQDIIQKYNGQAGSSSFAILTDERNLRLGHGRDANQLFKFLVTPGQETITQLQNENILPLGSQENLSTNLADFDYQLRNSDQKPVFTTYVGEDTASAMGEEQEASLSRAAVAKLTSRPWKVIFSQKETATLQPLQLQARVVGLFILGISSVLAILSVFISSLYAKPLYLLTDAASKIAQGDLDATVWSRSYEDEFGILARTFNDMTAQIRQNVATLETRVAERTRDIELRAFQLQTAVEMGNIVSSIRDVDKLLPEVVDLLGNRFGFYHVGIFLLDEAEEYAVLKAANSQGGRQMLDRGHRLQVGTTGIVGYVTDAGQPRISLDVGTDAVFFNNPDLPATRSEMALPLIVRGKVIGALDIQSDEANAFSESDVTVLRVVADQVAVAIENARLFVELESAADATRRAYGEVTARAWSEFAESQNVRGYLVRATDVAVSTGDHLTPEIASVLGDMRSGTVAKIDSHNLAVPIKFRNLILGAIRLKKEATAPSWTNDEINSLQNLADQLGAALENARLYRETQRSASRDRLVREIGDRMRRAPDMDTLIQTAVHEMARTLGVNEAFAQISSDMLSRPTATENNNGNDDGETQALSIGENQ